MSSRLIKKDAGTSYSFQEEEAVFKRPSFLEDDKKVYIKTPTGERVCSSSRQQGLRTFNDVPSDVEVISSNLNKIWK